MSATIRAIFCLLTIATSFLSNAQGVVKGKIVDAISNEPVQGASIQCTDEKCHISCISSSSGEFELHCKDCKNITVSFVGYQTKQIAISNTLTIELTPSSGLMNEVVVTATRG